MACAVGICLGLVGHQSLDKLDASLTYRLWITSSPDDRSGNGGILY